MDLLSTDRTFFGELDSGVNNSKGINETCFSSNNIDQCSLENSVANYWTVIFGICALIENLSLVFALANWNYKKQFKIFWFLWHLSLVDFMLALVFVFYNLRREIACPEQYICLPSFKYEAIFTFAFFFWTIIASNLFVLAIVVDRFIAILWPFRYADVLSTRHVRMVAGFVWTISFLNAFVTMVGIAIGHNTALFYSIATILGASITLFCSVVTVILNTAMLIYVWISIKSDTSSGNAIGSKLAVTLALFVASSVISSAPWSTALLICNGLQVCKIDDGPDYLLMLVLLHAFTSPLLYGFRVAEVKNRVGSYWKSYIDICIGKVTSTFKDKKEACRTIMTTQI